MKKPPPALASDGLFKTGSLSAEPECQASVLFFFFKQFNRVGDGFTCI